MTFDIKKYIHDIGRYIYIYQSNVYKQKKRERESEKGSEWEIGTWGQHFYSIYTPITITP